MNNRGAKYMAIALIILLFVNWGVTYTINLREQQSTIEAAKFRTLRLSEFFQNHVTATFRYADDYVKTVRRVYKQSGSYEAVYDYMAEIPPNTDILSHVVIMDTAGVPQFVSTWPKGKKPNPKRNAFDRDYFQFQKASKSDSVYISAARKGRNTGLVTVRLVRRLANDQGEFGGVVFAAVKQSQLLSFLETTHMEPSSSATLVGLDKKIRLRKSNDGMASVGKKLTFRNFGRIWRKMMPVSLIKPASLMVFHVYGRIMQLRITQWLLSLGRQMMMHWHLSQGL